MAITYRVKTTQKKKIGVLHSIDIFDTPKDAIAFLCENFSGYFTSADYKAIYSMGASDFLKVTRGKNRVSVHCYDRVERGRDDAEKIGMGELMRLAKGKGMYHEEDQTE